MLLATAGYPILNAHLNLPNIRPQDGHSVHTPWCTCAPSVQCNLSLGPNMHCLQASGMQAHSTRHASCCWQPTPCTPAGTQPPPLPPRGPPEWFHAHPMVRPVYPVSQNPNGPNRAPAASFRHASTQNLACFLQAALPAPHTLRTARLNQAVANPLPWPAVARSQAESSHRQLESSLTRSVAVGSHPELPVPPLSDATTTGFQHASTRYLACNLLPAPY